MFCYVPFYYYGMYVYVGCKKRVQNTQINTYINFIYLITKKKQMRKKEKLTKGLNRAGL